ncbi:MAG: substrate-binding domain-containing protein [Rhizobacter sp.]
MSGDLHVLSSMATRALLAELAVQWSAPVRVESVGGVDAAKRVAAGEAFDVVVLASDAIDRLVAAGHLAAESKVDLVRCDVAIAVPSGAPRPSVADEAGLRSAAAAAGRIAVSTGPSGVALAKLLDRWGIADRLVQAPPGVPVGRLLAQGEADLGFQQLSELIDLPGIAVLGTMPPGLEIVTTFSAARPATRDAVDAVPLLAHWRSAATDETKRRHGMMPARD